MSEGKFNLIYVPAETYMLSTAADNTVESFVKLRKPVNVLLLGDVGDKVQVLHENRKWLIEKTQLRGIYDQADTNF